MSSIFDRLCSDQLINDYPSHLKNNVHYETITGSTAYGVSDDTSDIDIYGFSIPPKHILFPYSYGNIVGFGNKPENFEQFQKHHIIDKQHRKEYDITIFNIVKYFQLCMENNPNMCDSLFTPTRCVLHSTSIANHVRDNRKLFLSKKVFHSFKGYAFSQLHKMKDKNALIFCNWCKDNDFQIDVSIEILKELLPTTDYFYIKGLIDKLETNGKRTNRLQGIYDHGFDVKYGYHCVRLIDETQMILEEHDLDITRSREHLKAIRRGEWTLDQIVDYFDTKIKYLEELYQTSTLQHSPDQEAIKTLLLECLEMHYGSLDKIIDTNIVIDKYIIEAYNNLEKAMRIIK